MLEILIIIALTKNNRKICLRKGYKPIGFQILTVILWIFFELFGIFIGSLIIGVEEKMILYLFALIGAGIGALISILIVKNLKDKNQDINTDQVLLDQNL